MKKFAFALVTGFVFSLTATAGDAPKAAAVPAKKAECASCATCTASTKTVTAYEPLTRREKARLPLVKEVQVKVVEVKPVAVKKAECCDSCTTCEAVAGRRHPVRRLLGR